MQESIEIKILKKSELNKFVDLIKLFKKVFEMDNFIIPKEEYLLKLLNRDDFDVFVAYKKEKILGGLTTYVLQQYYSEKPLAYIYDIAVKSDFQRQGIGNKLIETAKSFYKSNGVEDLFVQAEKIDKHAIKFYRASNPSEELKMIYFNYFLNK